MQKELHFNLLVYFPCNFSIMPPIMMKNRLFAVYTTYPNKQAKNPRVQLCMSLEYHLLASCGSPVLFKSSERNHQQSRYYLSFRIHTMDNRDGYASLLCKEIHQHTLSILEPKGVISEPIEICAFPL